MSDPATNEAIWSRPVSEVDPHGWDAVIAGAGPAGSIAAIHLANRGHKVLLIDRSPFPREKICGDAFFPDTWPYFEEVGLMPDLEKASCDNQIVHLYSPSGTRVVMEGRYLTCKRVLSDAMLVKKAVSAGAVLARGNVVSLGNGGAGVTTKVAELGEGISSRLGMVATGTRTRILKDSDMLVDNRSDAAAIRCYVRSAAVEPAINVWCDKSLLPGYGWLFPLPDREYNMGVGVFFNKKKHRRVDLWALFEKFVTEFAPAANVWSAATEKDPIKGAVLRCALTGARPYREPGIVAAGEAIGSTYPFTGEGISGALDTGRLAARAMAEALESGDLSRLSMYLKLLDKECRPRYFGYRVAQRYFSHGWLIDFFARRVEKSPALQKVVNDASNMRVDIRSVFTPKNLIRWFF